MPPMSSLEAKTAKPARRKKSGKKRKKSESDDEDEQRAFKKRPKAMVNRPMIQPPVDKVRKQRIELSIAKIDPNASFEERVAQFDRLEEIAKKRESDHRAPKI
jgi:hypothetical protein